MTTFNSSRRECPYAAAERSQRIGKGICKVAFGLLIIPAMIFFLWLLVQGPPNPSPRAQADPAVAVAIVKIFGGNKNL